MSASRKIKIREVLGMDCWCATHVDEHGYETDMIATGFCREVVIQMACLHNPIEEIVISYPDRPEEKWIINEYASISERVWEVL